MNVVLPTPDRFDFRRTALSHGWCTLPPFRIAADALRVDTVVAVDDDHAVPIVLEPVAGGVSLRSPGRQPAAVRRRLVAAARAVLGLDVDLRPFWDVVSGDPRHAWMARAGVGRILRAPDAWEDLVKLVLTTNCSWALTTRMTAALVETWGPTGPGGARAFPRPAALADAGERALRERGRTGYRAPYLVDLARRVVDGEVDPEAWVLDERPAAELRREMLELPGVGPYVAENLLKFLGRPAGLALDSWMRAKYARLHHGGRRVTDRTIARRHARLGDWAGLALWFELTRDWCEDGSPSESWDRLT